MSFRPDPENWKRSSFCEASGCVWTNKSNHEGHTVIYVKDDAGTTLAFSEGEWGDFIAGVKAGDFDL